MATISKRSGGSRGGAAPPAKGVGGGQRPPPISLSPNSQHGPLQKLGNEGIEFHALKALTVKEMVSGFWLLSTPFRVLGFAT